MLRCIRASRSCSEYGIRLRLCCHACYRLALCSGLRACALSLRSICFFAQLLPKVSRVERHSVRLR